MACYSLLKARIVEQPFMISPWWVTTGTTCFDIIWRAYLFALRVKFQMYLAYPKSIGMTMVAHIFCWQMRMNMYVISIVIEQQCMKQCTMCSITFMSSENLFIIDPFGVTSKNRFTGAFKMLTSTSVCTCSNVLLISLLIMNDLTIWLSACNDTMAIILVTWAQNLAESSCFDLS